MKTYTKYPLCAVIGLLLCSLAVTFQVQAQESSAQTASGTGTREAFNQKLSEIRDELNVLDAKYLGATSVFIPLENYVQEAKDCVNSGKADRRGFITRGLGLGCNAINSVITDAEVTNTGSCPGGFTTRGTGKFDDGYHFFSGGSERNYAFCVK